MSGNLSMVKPATPVDGRQNRSHPVRMRLSRPGHPHERNGVDSPNGSRAISGICW
jgi:hypothetical protein